MKIYMTTEKITDMTSDVTSTMIFYMTFDTKSDMTKQNYNNQVIVLLYLNLASFFGVLFGVLLSSIGYFLFARIIYL